MRVLLVVDAQRNAMFDFVLGEMPDFGDIRIMLEKGEVELARQMRVRFEQDMSLLDHIGWERRKLRDACAIRLPLDESRAIFERLLAEATSALGDPDVRAEDAVEEAHMVAETAEMVLGLLPEDAE